MANKRNSRNDLTAGIAFLTPNILGFLLFTLIPLVFSMALAFTNWDLRRHNMFQGESLQFVGLENFSRLFSGKDFWQYFNNTLFMMMGIPFAVAGSLMAAILLSQDLKGGSRLVWGRLVAGAVLVCSLGAMVVAGAGFSSMTILITGLAGMILMAGALGGTAVYRTFFYLPHFTAGVATYILWKKLYNPHSGPINNALRPIQAKIAECVQAIPAPVVVAGIWVAAGLMAVLFLFGARRFWLAWRDGEMGNVSALLGGVLLLIPMGCSCFWFSISGPVLLACIPAFVAFAFGLFKCVSRGRDFTCSSDKGIGHALVLGTLLLIGMFVCLGVGNICYILPEIASDGLEPPEWLTQFHWAKPALMVMGLWGAIGSNNMLMYLAGLSNVPQELYEAASIDGASPLQRFWNVTWPQLAPVTFFIVVMSIIHGLQGGFEMARTMTEGGPAGATTTLSYFVYSEGFETGRLGYASAIAWAMFAFVFVVTLVNWKFGDRYVND